MTLAPLKTIAVGALIATFFITASLARMAFRFSKKRHTIVQSVCRAHARCALAVMGIDTTTNGVIPTKHNISGGLIVANHLSYLDILVIASLIPARFVTSVEIRNTPFLGWICRLAYCLFVERRNRANRQGEIDHITEVLRSGQSVVLFPEGTSTDGEKVLPFKKSLIAGAIAAGVSVQPLCLNYQLIDREQVSRFNRDRLFWYGRMRFAPHLLRLMQTKEIVVNVDFLPALAGNSDHREVTRRAYELVNSRYLAIA